LEDRIYPEAVCKMIGGMDSTINQETKVRILENLGRACAKEHVVSFEKFKGDPNPFLKDLEKIGLNERNTTKKQKR